MEHLTAEQQANLKKNSTERLRARLAKAGWDDKEVGEMDRAALLEEVAKLSTEEGSTTPDMWARELALREQEIQLRKEELRLRAEEKQRE